jgi:diguanylate cyclase (GGDEF)-like protein
LLVLLYVPTIAVLLLSMAKERLEYEDRQTALFDPLTLIPNRRAFFMNAEKLAARYPAMPLSCLLFDLHNVKQINDTHGYRSADRVLQAFAQILTDHLPVCAYGRLRSEEFAAMIQADQSEAERLAEKISEALAQDSAIAHQFRIRPTVNIGLATGIGSSLPELLPQADAALYQAKASGRNSVVGAVPQGALSFVHPLQNK